MVAKSDVPGITHRWKGAYGEHMFSLKQQIGNDSIFPYSLISSNILISNHVLRLQAYESDTNSCFALRCQMYEFEEPKVYLPTPKFLRK